MKKKPTSAKINVKGTEIAVMQREDEDYISLTDMVRNFDGGSALIEQWLKNKDTVLFLGVWEQLNNPEFKSLEFEGIKNEAGRNSFYLSTRRKERSFSRFSTHGTENVRPRQVNWAANEKNQWRTLKPDRRAKASKPKGLATI